MTRKRTGLFGGTFDPVHIGHLIIAEVAFDALGLDSVEFLVAGDPPHKTDETVTPAALRIEMVRAAIADTPHFGINLVELERAGPSYTAETLRQLSAERDEDWFFIVGGDSLRDFASWREPSEIVRLARLAVIDRPGSTYDLDALDRSAPGIGARIDFVDGPLIDISSTELRERVRIGRSIRFQTVESVRSLIDEKRMYR